MDKAPHEVNGSANIVLIRARVYIQRGRDVGVTEDVSHYRGRHLPGSEQTSTGAPQVVKRARLEVCTLERISELLREPRGAERRSNGGAEHEIEIDPPIAGKHSVLVLRRPVALEHRHQWCRDRQRPATPLCLW